MNPGERGIHIKETEIDYRSVRLDLHMHTTVSDGTDRPEGQIFCVAEGCSIFTFTPASLKNPFASAT